MGSRLPVDLVYSILFLACGARLMHHRHQVVVLLLTLSLRGAHAANWSSAPLTTPGAVCINGGQTAVQFFINPVPSTVWVLTIGATSPGLGAAVCVSEQTCKPQDYR